jgi:ribosomal protein S3
VATKLVEEQQSSVEDIKQRFTAVKLLVPHSRMGSVIGKQGSKIKEVQDGMVFNYFCRFTCEMFTFLLCDL